MQAQSRAGRKAGIQQPALTVASGGVVCEDGWVFSGDPVLAASTILAPDAGPTEFPAERDGLPSGCSGEYAVDNNVDGEAGPLVAALGASPSSALNR